MLLNELDSLIEVCDACYFRSVMGGGFEVVDREFVVV